MKESTVTNQNYSKEMIEKMREIVLNSNASPKLNDEVEKDANLAEAKEIYRELSHEQARLADEIIEAMDKRDQVLMAELKLKREGILSAMKTIKESIDDELDNQTSYRDEFVNSLQQGAEFTRTRGNYLMTSITNCLQFTNDKGKEVAMKLVEMTHTGIGHGIEYTDKAGRFVINSTATGLDKLANSLSKK